MSHQLTEADFFFQICVSDLQFLILSSRHLATTVIIGRDIPTSNLPYISILSSRIGSKRDRQTGATRNAYIMGMNFNLLIYSLPKLICSDYDSGYCLGLCAISQFILALICS